MEQLPIILSKAYLCKHFKKNFRWIRRHLLNDKTLKELDIDSNTFKKYRTFPPDVSVKLRKHLRRKRLDK